MINEEFLSDFDFCRDNIVDFIMILSRVVIKLYGRG